MKKFWFLFFPGILIGILLMWGGGKAVEATSTDKFCNSCHIHPQAETSWKKSLHYETKSGVRIHCVECHLPPKGKGYLPQKVRTGLRDVYSQWFKDSASFNWEQKSQLEFARNHVYESTCVSCHKNIFPVKLTKEGSDAHLYYDNQIKKGEDIRCINCHLNAGHYDPNFSHAKNTGFGMVSAQPEDLFTEPTEVKAFEDFMEQIPGSPVSFVMKAIKGGTFRMGSPENESYREPDEGPVAEVKISSFFMAEVEVTWNEYQAFYAQTAAEGRSSDTEGIRSSGAKIKDLDAIIGATPPYGQPDQNWGKGVRPAISFSFHAAETYCRWLSQVTGKTYRLPTEAEWEYASRAGTETPYFFEGDPKKFFKKKFLSSRRDTTVINTYVVFAGNSLAKTQEPSFVQPNPFGLKNMLGNVAEFCSDWYHPDTYKNYTSGMVTDPKGPASGTEHVIRGGSFRNFADHVRSADRDFTRSADWLKTDPQIPKSLWWYSDCFYVGFRVVCEFDEKTGN